MRTLNTVMDTKSKSLIYKSTDSSINTLQAPFTFNPEWIINSLWSSHWVWKYPYSISSCIIFAVNSRWSGIVNLINNNNKKRDPHEWDMEIQTQKGGMYKLVIEAAINCTNAAIWIQWIGERWLIIFDARHLQHRSCALDSAASGCCSVLDQFKKINSFCFLHYPSQRKRCANGSHTFIGSHYDFLPTWFFYLKLLAESSFGRKRWRPLISLPSYLSRKSCGFSWNWVCIWEYWAWYDSTA